MSNTIIPTTDLKHSMLSHLYPLFSTLEKYFKQNPQLQENDFDDIIDAILDTTPASNKLLETTEQHMVIAQVFQQFRRLMNGTHRDFHNKYEQQSTTHMFFEVFPVGYKILRNRLFPKGTTLILKQLKGRHKLTPKQALDYFGYILNEVMLGLIDGVYGHFSVIGNLRLTIENLTQAAVNPYHTYENAKKYVKAHPWRFLANMAGGTAISQGLGFATEQSPLSGWMTEQAVQSPLFLFAFNSEQDEYLAKTKETEKHNYSKALVCLLERFCEHLIELNQYLKEAKSDHAKFEILVRELADISLLVADINETAKKAFDANDFDTSQKLSTIAKKASFIDSFIKYAQRAKDVNQLPTIMEDVTNFIQKEMPIFNYTGEEDWLFINDEIWLRQFQKACGYVSPARLYSQGSQHVEGSISTPVKKSGIGQDEVQGHTSSPGNQPQFGCGPTQPQEEGEVSQGNNSEKEEVEEVYPVDMDEDKVPGIRYTKTGEKLQKSSEILSGPTLPIEPKTAA